MAQKQLLFFVLHVSFALVDSFSPSPCLGTSKNRRSGAACSAVNPFDIQKSFSSLFGKFASTPEQPQPVRVSRKEELKEELRGICERAGKGLQTLPQEESARMKDIMDELEANFSVEKPAESPYMQGRWNMLWTTEKEILFLVEKGLFGLACTGVWQEINLEEGSLTNIIDFEEGKGMLKVGSSFMPDGDKFTFKFQTCSLKWNSISLPLPPVGQGWGQQVFLDEMMRIQRDSRGDVLIAEKAGPAADRAAQSTTAAALRPATPSQSSSSASPPSASSLSSSRTREGETLSSDLPRKSDKKINLFGDSVFFGEAFLKDQLVPSWSEESGEQKGN